MADILSAKTVEGLSLPLEGVNDVHGSDSLTVSMISVGVRVTDDVLKEDLEHTTGIFIDETGNIIDTTMTSDAADGGLGDALDVITKDFAVTLVTSFSATRYGYLMLVDVMKL